LIYETLLTWFSSIIDKDPVLNTFIIYELERVCRNHNILRWFDQSFCNNELRNNLREIGADYSIFANGTDSSKHQPVLWSEANSN
jgi:hypothetical protein